MSLFPRTFEPAPAPEAARAVLARHGRSFHFAAQLLGERHGERAARLYAFCRRVDDLADEARDAHAAAFALDGLASAMRNGDEGPAWLSDLRLLQIETGLPNAPLLDLIAGVRSDLGAVAIDTEEELIAYAYRVAGSVGLMMCAVLDVHDPRAHPFAIDLGIAMQLTNIARDVGTDAQLGRRYLPSAWVGAVGPGEILAPDAALQGRLRLATARLLDLAERYYRSGEAGIGFLPARARPAILTAARVYRGIGGPITRAGYRSWDRRAVVSGAGKLGHAAGALASLLLRPSLHRPAVQHDGMLHLALRALLQP